MQEGSETQVIIGLTGLAASGKGTAAQYLKEKYGFKVLVFSDIIKEEAERRGLLTGKGMEETKSILSEFGDVWRKETGRKDIVGQKLIEKIKEGNLNKVVVDGFRSVEEVELFRKTFKKFILIQIDASLEKRWERRLKQDPMSKRADFEARDRNDIEKKGLGDVIKMADVVVDNNKTKEDMYRQLDSIVSRLV